MLQPMHCLHIAEHGHASTDEPRCSSTFLEVNCEQKPTSNSLVSLNRANRSAIFEGKLVSQRGLFTSGPSGKDRIYSYNPGKLELLDRHHGPRVLQETIRESYRVHWVLAGRKCSSFLAISHSPFAILVTSLTGSEAGVRHAPWCGKRVPGLEQVSRPEIRGLVGCLT